MTRRVPFTVLAILLAGCGTPAIETPNATEEPITDASPDASDAGAPSDGGARKGSPSLTDAGRIRNQCVPQGGTVLVKGIDAAACIPDGGTGGIIVCYTLAESCAFCCVEQ